MSAIDAAPIQPSTCSGLRAPTMAPVTPGQASVQAMAIEDTDVSWRFAIGPSASRRQQIPPQSRLLELGRAAPPVIVGERRHAVGREGVRQQAGLHRAVADHAGVDGSRTTGSWSLAGRAVDQRERRLQRIDVPDRLAARQQVDVEIRHADRTHLAFLDELHHRRPGIFDRRAALVRPVKLIEVDALDPEPPERRLAFAPNRIGRQDAPRLAHAIVLVPDEPAFREDERPLRVRDLAQQLSHDFFGVPEPVHGGGVDPVDSPFQRVPHRRQRRGVVLRPPAERPAAAADGPRSKSKPGDLQSGSTQWVSR